MTSWTLAPSLVRLRAEVDAAHPGRSKVSDGTIGNAAHQATVSDHNPDRRGIVRAWDCTSSGGPAGDVAELVAEHLRARRDPRVKYVIWRGRMFSSYPKGACPAWTWRPYSGPNGHFHHVHVSVQPSPAGDSGRSWGYPPTPIPTPILEEDDDMAMSEADMRKLAGFIADAVAAEPAGSATVATQVKRLAENSIRAGVRDVLLARIVARAALGDQAGVRAALAELEATVFDAEGTAVGLPALSPADVPPTS